MPPNADYEDGPILYGDGVHDDTEALQWYIDKAVTPPWPLGTWLTREPLRLPRNGSPGAP